MVAPIAWLPFRPPFPSTEEIAGLLVHHPKQFYLPKLGRTLNPLLYALSTRPLITRLCPFDVILVNWAYPDACGIACVACDLRVPFVVSISGSDANRYLAYRTRRRQILSMLRQARAIIVRSRALKELLVSHGADADKIHVLYNGVDRTLFRPQTADHGLQTLTTGQSLQSPVSSLQSSQLLYVGRLSPEKGIDDLLRALGLVRDQHGADVRLTIVGDGPQRAELQRLATTLNLDGVVDWAGQKRPEEIVIYMNVAHLLCLPSHMEGVPNAALEAFACGLPVVATRVGGLPEVVTAETGILVEPHQPPALATALQDALARRWDHQAILTHAGRFDWTANARALLKILQRAAA